MHTFPLAPCFSTTLASTSTSVLTFTPTNSFPQPPTPSTGAPPQPQPSPPPTAKMEAKPAYTTEATIKTMGGTLLKLSHPSTSTKTPMAVSIFLPPSIATTTPAKPIPVLIYLSGLTCTPNNPSEKSFLAHHASNQNIALVFPDTSPRAITPPDPVLPVLPATSWDFGPSASFYINATSQPWAATYRMESYMSTELPGFLAANFGEKLDMTRVSISGHSMGGHGALSLYLKNHADGASAFKYKSVSAWAPICNPTLCPWGRKAFGGYLGYGEDSSAAAVEADDKVVPAEWKKHDATELLGGWETEKDLKMLIDVGTADGFYKQGQLLPENLEAVVKQRGLKGLEMRYQEGYDHSYYFISTFGEDHVKHAAKHLYS